MKITEELLKEIAIRYCKDRTPLSNLAKIYGVSKTTLVRYFNGERVVKLNPEIQKQVDEVKRTNWIDYKATEGNLGNKSLTDEEIVNLAQKMIDNDLVLEDLVTSFGPTKSTIYNLFTESVLGEELYSKVVDQYKKNKSCAFDSVNNKKR